jgi:hypothetical protein
VEQPRLTFTLIYFRTSNPGIKSSKPGLESSNPGIKSSKPGLESSNPGIKSLKPGLESSNPGIKSLKPGLESSNPDIKSSIDVLGVYLVNLYYYGYACGVRLW